MTAQSLIVLCLAVAASAVPLLPVAKVAYAELEAPAHYDFEYSVHDSHSGDVKQQKESRQGDAVQGSYSLLQPDGVQRIVEYTADKEHGFNAIVRYEGHPTPAPAKLAYAAPVAKLAYAAPVAKIAYQAAPQVAYHAAPAPVTYNQAAPAQVAYHQAAPAQFTYHQAAPAQIAYHQAAPAQVTYHQTAPAPVTYQSYQAAPVAKIAYAQAPVAKLTYAAPVAKVAYAAAPVAKIAYAAAPAKLYSESLGHVTFSSPAVSYQH